MLSWTYCKTCHRLNILPLTRGQELLHILTFYVAVKSLYPFLTISHLLIVFHKLCSSCKRALVKKNSGRGRLKIIELPLRVTLRVECLLTVASIAGAPVATKHAGTVSRQQNTTMFFSYCTL